MGQTMLEQWTILVAAALTVGRIGWLALVRGRR